MRYASFQYGLRKPRVRAGTSQPVISAYEHSFDEARDLAETFGRLHVAAAPEREALRA